MYEFLKSDPIPKSIPATVFTKAAPFYFQAKGGSSIHPLALARTGRAALKKINRGRDANPPCSASHGRSTNDGSWTQPTIWRDYGRSTNDGSWTPPTIWRDYSRSTNDGQLTLPMKSNRVYQPHCSTQRTYITNYLCITTGIKSTIAKCVTNLLNYTQGAAND